MKKICCPIFTPNSTFHSEKDATVKQIKEDLASKGIVIQEKVKKEHFDSNCITPVCSIAEKMENNNNCSN